jgi:Holliday junction DNA helicase RuvA
MISAISGKIIQRGQNYLIIEIADISYEVLVPVAVMQRLQENIDNQGKIRLVTFHYLQGEQNKSIPVLIGFLNEIERDFFEVFITVSGIGPRAALKALSKPISQIAKAIDEADLVFLKSLPGIGEQRAKEIIAKLQNKIGKFGLIQDSDLKESDAKTKNIQEEALAVLTQLQYRRSEALSMIKKALEAMPRAQTTEELLNTVYKQKKII